MTGRSGEVGDAGDPAAVLARLDAIRAEREARERAEAERIAALDQRLAAALLGHGNRLLTTHQALADELGTVREIVTRLLRRFEREGWVTLSREHIHISNSAALRALASSLPA